jgi:flagellin-like protein
MMKPIRRNLKKKGISPVIASIILIAVTIAIGVAIAGFVFGIFGTYSAAPNVSITSSRLFANATVGVDDTLRVTLKNTGTGNVIVSQVMGGALTVTPVASGEWLGSGQGNTIAGNAEATIYASLGVDAVSSGSTYSFTINLGGGSQLTAVVTAETGA